MGGSITVVVHGESSELLGELGESLSDLPVQLVGFDEIVGAQHPAVGEGGTLEELARERARAARDATQMLCLADAGGLEVDVLGGRPGVRSARFAHERATDAENNAALLRELEDVEESDRSARFRWVAAVANPWREEILTVQGTCVGLIARTPRGGGGFGYEPLFMVMERDRRVMTELSEPEKRSISPRRRGIGALRPVLTSALNQLLDQTERIGG